MKQTENLETRVERTLNSLDGIQRAEPQPWLFARIQGRLMREERTVWGTMSSLLAKPAIAIAGLCFILIMNGFILFNQEKESPLLSSQGEQALDSESLIASSSSFDYETLVQP